MLYWTRGSVGSIVVAGLVVVVVVPVGIGAFPRSLRREEYAFWDADITKVVVVFDDGEASVVVSL